MKPYTHPSLNIVNSVTVKLIDKNYIFWKWQFQVFLNGQGLLGFVTGSLTFSSTDHHGRRYQQHLYTVPNPDNTLWFQTEQVVQSWLSEDIQSIATLLKRYSLLGRSF